MIARGLALLVLASLSVRAADDSASIALKRRTLCNALHTCRIPGEGARCTEAESAPLEGTVLDENYCSWVRTFAKKGILPGTYATNELYRRMGSEYHIMYVMHDTVPVPVKALDFLVGNVPLTCKLINAYQKTSYEAHFASTWDSSYFSGTNGRNLTGNAKQVWAGSGGMERVYYGDGKVSILTWKMRGDVIVELRYWPRNATSCNYSARFTMFPVNGFINSVMNMGIFKSTAIDKIQEVLSDISQAANAYALGKPPKQPQVYTPAELQALKRFGELFKAGN
jgi:hypothetical protein